MTIERHPVAEVRTDRTGEPGGTDAPSRSPQFGIRALFAVTFLVMAFAATVMAVMYLLPGLIKT